MIFYYLIEQDSGNSRGSSSRDSVCTSTSSPKRILPTESIADTSNGKSVKRDAVFAETPKITPDGSLAHNYDTSSDSGTDGGDKGDFSGAIGDSHHQKVKDESRNEHYDEATGKSIEDLQNLWFEVSCLLRVSLLTNEEIEKASTDVESSLLFLKV